MPLFTNLASFHKAILVIKVPMTESQCPTSFLSKFTTFVAFFNGHDFVGVLEGFVSFSLKFPPASCFFSRCGFGRLAFWRVLIESIRL